MSDHSDEQGRDQSSPSFRLLGWELESLGPDQTTPDKFLLHLDVKHRWGKETTLTIATDRQNLLAITHYIMDNLGEMTNAEILLKIQKLVREK